MFVHVCVRVCVWGDVAHVPSGMELWSKEYLRFLDHCPCEQIAKSFTFIPTPPFLHTHTHTHTHAHAHAHAHTHTHTHTHQSFILLSSSCNMPLLRPNKLPIFPRICFSVSSDITGFSWARLADRTACRKSLWSSVSAFTNLKKAKSGSSDVMSSQVPDMTDMTVT